VRALPAHALMVGMPGGDDKTCLLYHCQGHMVFTVFWSILAFKTVLCGQT
jgi:hypothetical protein